MGQVSSERLSSPFNKVSLPKPQRTKKSETKMFGIRLTDDERRLLDQRAGNEHVSTWARDVLLSHKARKRRKSRKPQVSDKNLALVIALFGDQRIASNLNQLARHANMGTLDFDDHTLEQIQEACAAMIAVRNYLLDTKEDE